MSEKLPYLQFFVDDWLSDERLRLCSLAARGLWIDLLCLMHKNGHRGFLDQANGSPLTCDQIARMTGAAPAEVGDLLRELSDAGVSSASDQGIIFNRRMVRDEKLRVVRSQAGQKGGEQTGRLLKQNAKQSSSNHASKPPSNPLEYGDGDGIALEKGGGPGAGKTAARPEPKFDLTAEGLAQAWCFHHRGSAAAQKNPFTIAVEFREWIERSGVKPEAMLAEILNPARNRTEPTWTMFSRLATNEKQRKGNHANKPSMRYDAARDG